MTPRELEELTLLRGLAENVSTFARRLINSSNADVRHAGMELAEIWREGTGSQRTAAATYAALDARLARLEAFFDKHPENM